MPSPTSPRRDMSHSALPAISEDDNDRAPSFPSLSPSRRVPETPVRFSPGGMEPGKALAFSDTSSTLNEDKKPLGLRENEHIAKRGGWKRLALIALVAIACLLAMIVGLAVALRNRNRNNRNGSIWTTTSNSTLNTTYPAGSYSIQAYLSNVTNNCTLNSATWRCYPYTTYSSSPQDALTTLNLIISAFTTTSQSSPTYTVSTSENPFSINFSNATLVLLDSGLHTERYSFNVTMNKPVTPIVALDSSELSVTCYFNSTTFQANLYTKMNMTYPSANASSAFAPWPHAVTYAQVATGGSSTPDCVDLNGDTVGDFSVADQGEVCSCSYVN